MEDKQFNEKKLTVYIEVEMKQIFIDK